MNSRLALLVDDDPVVHLLVSDLLRHLGLKTEIATNLDDAWSQISERRPDILLLDLFLADGITASLLTKLAHNYPPPAPPVLLITSHEEVGYLLSDVPPPSTILRKPFTLPELRGALQKLGIVDKVG